MNYNHMTLAHMMSHLNIPQMDGPEYPYVRSWEERVNARRSGAGGNRFGGADEEDED